MKTPTAYVIRFFNKGQTEEYDAGQTIAAARKEAAFFRANMPADTEIRICKLRDGSAYLVEVAS